MFSMILAFLKPPLVEFLHERVDAAQLKYDWLKSRLDRAMILLPQAAVSQEEVEQDQYLVDEAALALKGAQKMLQWVQENF